MSFHTYDPEKRLEGLTPKQALQVFSKVWPLDVCRAELFERLKHGLLVTSASHALCRQYGSEKQRELNVIIPNDTWSRVPAYGPSDTFWQTGRLELAVTSVQNKHDWTFFDVRFSASALQKLLSEQTSASLPATDTESKNQQPSLPVEQKKISNDEIDRLAKAVAAGWKDKLTEVGAWTFAKELRPEYKIAKQRFLVQYRIYRGEKKPGKQKKNGN